MLRAGLRDWNGKQELPSTTPLHRLSRRGWRSLMLSPAAPMPSKPGHRKYSRG
jgi:hypothetical protein